MKKGAMIVVMCILGLSIVGCSKPAAANSSYVGTLVLQNGEQYYWGTVEGDLEIGELILEVQERISPQLIPKEGQSNMLAKGTPVYRVKNYDDKVIAIDGNGQYVFIKKSK